MEYSIVMTEASKRMLKRQPQQFSKGTILGLKVISSQLERDAKNRFGFGGGPNVRSGYLRRSITSNVIYIAGGVVVTLGSNAIYAAIQEYGGVVTPKVSKYLTFKGKHGWVKSKLVKIPGTFFLKQAIIRNTHLIKELVTKSINKEMNK